MQMNQTKPNNFGPIGIQILRWSFKHLKLQNKSTFDVLSLKGGQFIQFNFFLQWKTMSTCILEVFPHDVEQAFIMVYEVWSDISRNLDFEMAMTNYVTIYQQKWAIP